MNERLAYVLNRQLKKRSESIFEGISNGRKKALENWFKDQWMQLHSVAKSLSVLNETPQSLEEILKETVEHYNIFLEVFVLDSKGMVIASSFQKHIGDSLKEFPNLSKGLSDQCYMYGPYCDKNTLDIPINKKHFFDEVTLLFSEPYKNNDEIRIVCARVLNDDMSNVIQDEDTHIYKDSGDNYLFMVKNSRGIPQGSAISRSRFEDRTFTLGENLKDGVRTRRWGEIKIQSHTEFEIMFDDPATNKLHQGVQYTINNEENLDCWPGYPDYRHIMVGGKGTLINPPNSDEIWGMMCEGDIAEIYNFHSIDKKVPIYVGFIAGASVIFNHFLAKLMPSQEWGFDFLLFLFILIASFAVTKIFIVRPLNKTIKILRNIADGEGDLTKRVPVYSPDEIGELSRWFNKFLSNQMNMLVRVGNSVKIAHKAVKRVARSTKKIEAGMITIGETVSTLAQNSLEQNELFKETQREVKKIADSFEKNDELEKLISEINQKTEATTSAASSANELTDEVLITTDELESVMKNAVDNIANLDGKSKEITQIISTITAISSQTKLLALNASIEAARAGEAGRSFTVVAEEIKNLATQTNDATRMVEQLISAIQQEITNTNTNIDDIDSKVTATIKSAKESTKAVALVIDVSKTITYILNIMSEQNIMIKEVRKNIYEMAQKSEKNTLIGEKNSHQAAEHIEDIMKQTYKLNQILDDMEYSSDDLAEMVTAFKVQ